MEKKSLRRGIAWELIADLVAVVLIGAFAADHSGEPRFLIPAIALDVYAVAIVAAMVRQLVMLRDVDFSEPVALVQERLQKLRLLRIRTTLGTLLFAPLMWLPLLIVAARVLGADVYAASPAWLGANVLLGLAVIPVSVWLARRYGERAQQSSALRALADQIAGRSLSEALRDLQTLRAFTASA